ncbi:helix-turn-helix transcriptional regulator [Aquihabitans sp. McL0605]|uniref:helix-turn-helix transcriptional regulator n=1 Tax=Aquihabitans sp. McL0605 TaxID=3415671 RepID=UPI003CE9AC9A
MTRADPVAASAPDRAGVPMAISPFIGRAAELRELEALLGEHRLLTVTGPGGSGKTRLALEVAHRAQGATVVGVIELAPVARPDLVGEAIRVGLDVPERPDQEARDLIVAAIGDQRELLVLDNCEHVIEAVADVVGFLLARCSRLVVLTTSRERLGIPGEVGWVAPALALPPRGTTAPAAIATADALRLFDERARLVQPSHVLDADSAPVVLDLLHRLDGMPLAIELAAALLRVMSLNELTRHLAEHATLPDDPGRRATPRHQTLTASIAWSHDLLTAPEQITFRRLAVFAGGFGIDAATAVVPDPVLDRRSVRTVLTGLVDRSLVQAERGGDGEMRFSLLETLRAFAFERLEEAGEAAAVRDRHLGWVQQMASEAEPALTGSAQRPVLDRLELEHANLRAALDWATRCGRVDDAGAIAADLTWFWKLHGHLTEGLAVLELAADDATLEPDLGRRVRWSQSDLLYWAGRFGPSYELAVETLEEAEAAGDDWIVARSLWGMANVECFIAPPAAHEHARRAAAVARTTGDAWCLAVSLQVQVLTSAPDAPGAAPWIAEAEAIGIELRNPQLDAWNSVLAVRRFAESAAWPAADSWYERGLDASLAIGDAPTRVTLTFMHAATMLERGRPEVAAAAVERCRRQVSDQGADAYQELLEATDARILVRTDPTAVYARLIDRPLPTGAVVSVLDVLPRSVAALAALLIEGPETAQTCAEALELARRLGKPESLVNQLLVSALSVLDHDPSAAEALLHEALETLGGPSAVARAHLLEALGAAAAARQLDLDAARLIGAARAWRAGHGCAAPVWTLRSIAPLEHDARSRIGSEAFDAAVDEGATMTLDDATRYARRRRGVRGRAPAGWSSLTPTEARVVDLAAEGLTNPAIAARLFVSVGTVKTHLNHVYAKLGLTNRTELAAAAARRNAPQPHAAAPHDQPV